MHRVISNLTTRVGTLAWMAPEYVCYVLPLQPPKYPPSSLPALVHGGPAPDNAGCCVARLTTGWPSTCTGGTPHEVQTFVFCFAVPLNVTSR